MTKESKPPFSFRIQASKQFSKSDVVDIARAMGINASDAMSVANLKALLTIHFNTGERVSK